MKNKYYLFILTLLTASTILTGCQEMNSNVEKQLDNLNKRAEELDSAVNKGLDKVDDLDSTISAKTKRIKNLDSIVRRTTTRIDSIVDKNTEEINRRIN